MKEVLSHENRWNYKIVIFPIMLFVTTFIIWSIFAEIDEVVNGDGRVVPSSQTKILQNLEGGIVEEIYLQEGDQVKKGEALYKLKNAFSSSDTNQKEIKLESLIFHKERLEAEINFEKELVFSKELGTDNLNTIKNEQKIFMMEMRQYKQDLNLLKDQLIQNRLMKKQKSLRLKNLKKEMMISSQNLHISKKLLSQGAVSKREYLGELAKKQSLVTQISEIESDLPILNQKIVEAKNKIESFKSEKKTSWLKELSLIELEITQLNEKKIANSDREKRKFIVSPVNGVIKKLYYNTVGGIIKSGDNIAEITPMEDALIVEANIKTNDRGEIWIDQNVSIEITAYNYARYGLLKGKLIFISPDSFINRDGSSYYKVKVKVDNYSFAKDKPILAGMIANIHILTGKKTIFEYILKPLKDISQYALTEK